LPGCATCADAWLIHIPDKHQHYEAVAYDIAGQADILSSNILEKTWGLLLLDALLLLLGIEIAGSVIIPPSAVLHPLHRRADVPPTILQITIGKIVIFLHEECGIGLKS
jgi:hypothetical protein